MALQLGALREALINAGATPDKADKASEELAGYDNDLRLLKWMVAGIYAILALLGAPALWLLLRVAAKVGASDDCSGYLAGPVVFHRHVCRRGDVHVSVLQQDGARDFGGTDQSCRHDSRHSSYRLPPSLITDGCRDAGKHRPGSGLAGRSGLGSPC